ncbi:hypothetical protein AZ66_18395 [Paenibacillus sp. E194]|nr:hypothetical protein AZ66_18395 [Paenibacillus sp. E194]
MMVIMNTCITLDDMNVNEKRVTLVSTYKGTERRNSKTTKQEILQAAILVYVEMDIQLPRLVIALLVYSVQMVSRRLPFYIKSNRALFLVSYFVLELAI